jgi:Mg2+ and Co2+ transporter CorA
MSMTTKIPLAEQPAGFWIHVSIMVAISLFTIILFKARKWL